ncbi:MAG TPA: hypothetical protein DCO75_09685 [Fibrobacteres bacterium]|jgi:hypothetical protein|nr:hypothetical protein [Fibrobacterota bacterium]
MFKRIVACLVLAAFISVNTGCYGSFSLTKKIYKWNGSLGDKFLKSIVFWAFSIIPVYETCAFIDAIALNLIEFWAGSNPLALNSDTEIQKTFEANGKVYNVTMGKGKINISEIAGPDAGKQITLAYKQDASAWYMSSGQSTQMVASFNPKPLNTVNLYYPDGKVISQNIDSPELASAK